MSAITRFEVNGEISSLTGPLGSVYNATINPPALSNVSLWTLGTKQYNHYLINSGTFFNIILPEIGPSNNNAKIGYNVTIVNTGINNFVIRDFNNNFILELYAKKSVKLIAMDTFQNWSFSSTLFRYNSLPGTDLLQNSISDFEYTLKNLISSDNSVDITDLSNQIDLKSKIGINPPGNILDVYISTTGSDANDGLTLATPVLELSRALEVANQHGWNSQINLNFAAGNYILPVNIPYVFKYSPLGSNSGGWVFKGDAPTLFVSYVIIATDNTTLAPTQFAMINPGIGMPVNAYNGLCATFTSGANVGKSYQIAENTANEIYLLTNDTFAPGDTFDICQNSTTITTRGNRFSDGYLIISNLDIILEDRPVVTPNEIYSWEIIDSFIIYDNCRILTNPTVTNPNVLFYGDTLISSDNTHIFADAYTTQNLGVAIDGSNLSNPSSAIRLDYINSFVSTSKAYNNRAIGNFQNSQAFSFLFYFNNVETIQMFATSAFFGQVVFKNCSSASSGLLQLDNNATLFLDGMRQEGLTAMLTRCGASSILFINNGIIDTLDVIGTTENLSSLGLNSVNINSITGSNPNRTFSNSNISFSGCNFNTLSHNIEFKCCTCVAFDNTTILGPLEISFNNSTVSFNSFVNDSTNALIFNNCRVIGSTLTLNPSVSFSRLSFSQCICSFDTLNLAEVEGPGYSMIAVNSIISVNNINIQNPGSHANFSFNLNNTTMLINNFNLSNLASDFTFLASTSTIYVSSLTSNTNGNNFLINLNLSIWNLYNNLNHNGNLAGGQYLVLNTNSVARFGIVNFGNCAETFCLIGSGSSLIIDNGSINSSGKFISSTTQTFGLVQLNNVTFASVTTPTDLFDLHGGKLVLTNVNIGVTSVGFNGLFTLNNCDATCDNITVNTLTAGGFNLYGFSKLTLSNSSLQASGGSLLNGINSDNASIIVANTSINNFSNGINLFRKSHGIIDGTSGVNNLYGIVVNSGSGVSQNGTNVISGGSGDVQVGALGGRNWGAVNAGNNGDTNDFGSLIPQYVFISPV